MKVKELIDRLEDLRKGALADAEGEPEITFGSLNPDHVDIHIRTTYKSTPTAGPIFSLLIVPHLIKTPADAPMNFGRSAGEYVVEILDGWEAEDPYVLGIHPKSIKAARDWVDVARQVLGDGPCADYEVSDTDIVDDIFEDEDEDADG